MASSKAKKSPYDDLHIVNMGKYQKSIDTLWAHTVEEASKLGVSTGFENGGDGGVFSFDNYPKSRKKLNDLLWRMREDMERIVDSGIVEEWNLANAKNSAMVEKLTKDTKVPKDVLNAMQPHNGDALEAFQFRKIRGLGLSDRVWNITEQFKAEMETAIDVGLAKGTSAAELSREVRKMLKEPDMMYRRFREKNDAGEWVKYWRRKYVDADGTVHWIKEPLANTGRGVYRSSYKNAMRMTRTETNMAYHKADNEFYRQSVFVLGFRVILSNNHTCNGVRLYDICDEFNGKEFPVDFDFPGWHPMCRCVTVPITPKESDVVDYLKKIVNDEDVSGYQFNGMVKDLPDEFKQWVADNEERLAAMQARGTLPYFVKDNLADGYKFGMGLDVQDGWKWAGNTFITEDLGNGITSFSMETVIPKGKTPEELALEADLAQYPQEIQDNMKEFERRFGQRRGLSMTFEEADTGKENPLYKTAPGYRVNCQTCTVTHELRRRGFNVEAFENNQGGNRVWRIYDKHKIGYRTGKWIDPKTGKPVGPYYAENWAWKKGYKKLSKERCHEFLREMMHNDGRFEIYCDWKGGSAHVFLAERKNGVIRFFDPQTGKEDVLDKYLPSMKLGRLGIVRIDNKIIRPELAQTFVCKGELPIKVIDKQARIKAIAAARHAARTNEHAQELIEFWENKVKEGDKRRHREQIFANAAKRHAARTQAEIDAIKAARKAETELYAQIQKDAADMAKTIKDNPWLDDAIASELTDKKYSHNLHDLAKRTAEIGKDVKLVEADMAYLETYIPDVKGTWAKQFTSAELHSLYDSVEKNINKWADLWTTDPWLPKKYPDFDHYLQHKLETEVMYVTTSGKKYKTWQVAGSAYTKKLTEVKVKIQKTELNAELGQFKGISGASKALTDEINAAQDLINQGKFLEAKQKIAYISDFKTLSDEFDALASYHTGKFDAAYNDAKALFAKGDLTAAKTKLEEAKKIKATNEASNAAKAAKTAAAKAAKEAEQKEIYNAAKLAWEDTKSKGLATKKSMNAIDKAIAAGDEKKVLKALKEKYGIDTTDPANPFRQMAKSQFAGAVFTDQERCQMALRMADRRIAKPYIGTRKMTSAEELDNANLLLAAQKGDIKEVDRLLAKMGIDFSDPHGDARRDAAFWFHTKSDANDYMFPNAVDTWAKASQSERRACCQYTVGSAYITEPCRAIPGYYYQNCRQSESLSHTKLMTEYIGRSVAHDDVWIKRDEIGALTDYKFGSVTRSPLVDSLRRSTFHATTAECAKLKTQIESELSKLIGTEGVDESFLSCGSCRDAKFSGTGGDNKYGVPLVTLNIYCPKGTNMTYAEPFNAYAQFGTSWDGRSKPTRFNEAEVFLQRGTRFKVRKVEYDPDLDKIFIDVDIIEQNPRDIKQVVNTSRGYYFEFEK